MIEKTYEGNIFLDKLKEMRKPVYQHTWDVYASDEFQIQYAKLPEHVRECVIANVAVLIHTKWPNTFGNDVFDGERDATVLDIGESYKLKVGFSHWTHVLSLYGVYSEGSNDKALCVILPRLDKSGDDPDAEWFLESYEETLAESYKRNLLEKYPNVER